MAPEGLSQAGFRSMAWEASAASQEKSVGNSGEKHSGVLQLGAVHRATNFLKEYP